MSETERCQQNVEGKLVVGAIGLGDMGSAIVSSIVRHLPVVGYDMRSETVQALAPLGVTSADSISSIADQADVALVVVANDAQVKSVVGELFRHKGRLRSIIVSSTILPKTMIALKEEADRLGIDLIDAPVSGGAEKASRGTITILIGGDEDAVKRNWPVFQAFGGNIFHLGPIGAGSAGKLVNNLLSIAGNALQLEAMQLADCYGITEERVTEFVAVSAGDSRGLRTWGRIDRARRIYRYLGAEGTYELFSKDVKYAALAAAQCGVVLPIAASIGAMIPEKMKTRDKLLEERGLAEIPRCSVCGQELALPFRENGAHPECRGADAANDSW